MSYIKRLIAGEAAAPRRPAPRILARQVPTAPTCRSKREHEQKVDAEVARQIGIYSLLYVALIVVAYVIVWYAAFNSPHAEIVTADEAHIIAQRVSLGIIFVIMLATGILSR